MEYDVIINAKSGSGMFAEKENQQRLREIFKEAGHEINLHVVEPESLDETIQESLASPSHALIIGGGDGSVTSTANLSAASDKPLGVLPLGTFNLEARDLNLPLDPFESARQLTEGEFRKIDLLRINQHPCLCTVVLGFYPALAKARERMQGVPWWRKSIRIAYELLVLAVRSPFLNLSIDDGEKTITRRTRLTSFSPGEYNDEFGLIPSRENLSSGKVTAYLSSHLSRFALFKMAWGYISGNLFTTDDLTILQSQEFTVSAGRRKKLAVMIDGEILSLSLPFTISIEPKSLTVLVPKKS